MTAYLLPALLSGYLVYMAGRREASKFEKLVERGDQNQGLEALEIIMKASGISSFHELRKFWHGVDR